MFRTLVLAAIVAGLVATSASAVEGGVRGVVLRGPTTPVCRAELPCSGPAPNATVVFTRAHRSHSTKTDAHGRYRITLAPGTYSIKVIGARLMPNPHVATVASGRVTTVNLTIDTGIR